MWGLGRRTRTRVGFMRGTVRMLSFLLPPWGHQEEHVLHQRSDAGGPRGQETSWRPRHVFNGH